MKIRGSVVALLVLLACDRTGGHAGTKQDLAPEAAKAAISSGHPPAEASPRVPSPPDAALRENEVEAARGNEGAPRERKAILDGLRAEVQRQYAGSKTLATAELVFVVKVLRSDEKFAYVYAEAFRKTSAGNVKIVQADFEGTKFEPLVREGIFDGPTVIAVLSKGKGAWSVARFPKGADKGQLAIALGPTDFPGDYYLEMFGLPASWGR